MERNLKIGSERGQKGDRRPVAPHTSRKTKCYRARMQDRCAVEIKKREKRLPAKEAIENRDRRGLTTLRLCDLKRTLI